MEGWSLALTVLGIGVGVLGLLAPALVYLGMRLGTLQHSTQSAHLRINSLELRLVEELRELRGVLTQNLATWRQCPLDERHPDREQGRGGSSG